MHNLSLVCKSVRR